MSKRERIMLQNNSGSPKYFKFHKENSNKLILPKVKQPKVLSKEKNIERIGSSNIFPRFKIVRAFFENV
jgi:hypothetical protein